MSRVNDVVTTIRVEHGAAWGERDRSEAWRGRERVVVALSGTPAGDALVRRGARIAGLAAGGELLALHVTRSDGLTGASPDALDRQRELVETLGGSWHTVVADDVASAVLDFARSAGAGLIVLGASRHGRFRGLLAPAPAGAIVRNSAEIDVHLVSHVGSGGRASPARTWTRLGPRRSAAAWLLATVGAAVLLLLLDVTRDLHGLAAVVMLFLSLTVGVALVGGMAPAVFAALTGSLLANYFFTRPLYTFKIDEPENGLALVVLLAVAVAVSLVVDVAARHSVEAARARAEADTLTALAGTVLRGGDALPALLRRLQESLGLARVALEEATDDGWREVAAASTPTSGRPGPSGVEAGLDSGGATSDRPDPGGAAPAGPVATLAASETMRLTLWGHRLDTKQARLAGVVATQVESVLERDRLRAEASAARAEKESTAIRTALLAAVSHDLRTPLAGVKAAVGALRSPEVHLEQPDHDELLAQIEDSSDRLQSLIDNLLDLSRLDAGSVQARPGPVALDELVPEAMAGLPGDRFVIDVPESLPLVHVDEGLVERALGNILENAVRYSPADRAVVVSAVADAGRAVVHIADHGPGVPATQKGDLFRAFQRLGDAPAGQGLGLGLAVAKGFVEASGGTLEARDTPGGGLTLVVTLPLAEERLTLVAAGSCGEPQRAEEEGER